MTGKANTAYDKRLKRYVKTLHKGRAGCEMCPRQMAQFDSERLMRWCSTCKRIVDVGPVVYRP